MLAFGSMLGAKRGQRRFTLGDKSRDHGGALLRTETQLRCRKFRPILVKKAGFSRAMRGP